MASTGRGGCRFKEGVADLSRCVEVDDFEAEARRVLPVAARDYYAGGAADEITLRENCAAFRRLTVWPRVLVDVSHVDTSAMVLGTRLRMPLLIAPTAFHRMAHVEGERATARAARAEGMGMVASTLASCPLEEIAAEGPEPRWFQLYVHKDRDLTERLVARAEEAGYAALALTVDAPRFGRRYADMRNGFTLPEGITVANFAEAGCDKLESVEGRSGLALFVAKEFDASLTWREVEWLRSRTLLPIVLKGIVHPEDARLAVEHGADGIVVSNHGGRQLDTAPATITALPGVVEAAAGRLEVLMDGGVRRGTDILKAVALGARAVLVGRPVLWGLAAGGEEGVRKVLQVLREEFELAMMLAGCPSVADIGPELLQAAAGKRD